MYNVYPEWGGDWEDGKEVQVILSSESNPDLLQGFCIRKKIKHISTLTGREYLQAPETTYGSINWDI